MIPLLQVNIVPTGLEGLGEALRGFGFTAGQFLNRENILRRQIANNPEMQQTIAFEYEQLRRGLEQGSDTIQTEEGVQIQGTPGVDAEDAQALAIRRIAEARNLPTEVVAETIETTPLTLDQRAQLAAEKQFPLDNLLGTRLGKQLLADAGEAETAISQSEFQTRFFDRLVSLGVPSEQALAQSRNTQLEGERARVALGFLQEWEDVMNDLEGIEKQHALQALENPEFLRHLDRRANMDLRALLSEAASTDDPVEAFKDKFMLLERIQGVVEKRFDELRRIEEEGESFEGQRREVTERLNQALTSLKMAADLGVVPIRQAETFRADVNERALLPDRLEVGVYLPGVEDERVASAANTAFERILDPETGFEEVGPALRDIEAAARQDEMHFWNSMTPSDKESFRQQVISAMNPVREQREPTGPITAREGQELARERQLQASRGLAELFKILTDLESFERPNISNLPSGVLP